MNTTDLRRLTNYYAKYSTKPIELFFTDYCRSMQNQFMDSLMNVSEMVRISKQKWDKLTDQRRFYYVLWANKNRFRAHKFKKAKKQH